MNIIALIPARSGSKRIPNKNIKELNGHPLLAYTIAAAKEADIFERIILSTDSQEIADIGIRYGAEVPFLRPKEYATDFSPEFEWINHLINNLPEQYDCFADLRPTNPLRSAKMIRRAWDQFQNNQPCHSLRAIEKCKQHPEKMWFVEELDDNSKIVIPYISRDGKSYYFNFPTQALEEVYIQNASMEIAWISVLKDYGNVSGEIIVPFFTEGYGGFDINTMEDWWLAELLIEKGLAKLPEVKC